MNIDICIPVWRNLKCLRAAMDGVAHYWNGPDTVRVLLHVQDPGEAVQALDCCYSVGLKATIVSTGDMPDMAATLNKLFAESSAPWTVFMEQDTFVHVDLTKLAEVMAVQDFIVGGPVDTYHYGHQNARRQPHYGEHGRLSPQPGYYHSSLVLLNREVIAAKCKAPFTIPAGFKMHGTGVLGGESYYGLRMNCGEDKTKLAFFQQNHAPWGYAAGITWGEWTLATHLFYSSTKDGYRNSFLSESEHKWLCEEEDRFLKDYATR